MENEAEEESALLDPMFKNLSMDVRNQLNQLLMVVNPEQNRTLHAFQISERMNSVAI